MTFRVSPSSIRRLHVCSVQNDFRPLFRFESSQRPPRDDRNRCHSGGERFHWTERRRLGKKPHRILYDLHTRVRVVYVWNRIYSFPTVGIPATDTLFDTFKTVLIRSDDSVRSVTVFSILKTYPAVYQMRLHGPRPNAVRLVIGERNLKYFKPRATFASSVRLIK